MQFCDECGSMMRADGGVMVCSSCGATAEQDTDLSEAYTSTESQTDDDVIESSEESAMESKPTATDVRCEQCGHGEAWYEIRQTGSADEPPTRFFKCKDCGHRWRGYG